MLTVHGNEVVIRLGRLSEGSEQTVHVSANLSSDLSARTMLKANAVLRSSMALPVRSNEAPTLITKH